jgi:hypothetical protein
LSPFLNSRASGSVVLAWVSLLRRLPFQLACALRPPLPPPLLPSLGVKLLWLAQA